MLDIKSQHLTWVEPNTIKGPSTSIWKYYHEIMSWKIKKNALYSLHSLHSFISFFHFFTLNVCFLEATLFEKIIKVLILVIETSQNCTIKDCNPLLNTITVMPLHKKRCILPFGHSKYLLENSNHFSWLFQKKNT